MSRFAIAVVIFLVLNLVYWDLHGRSTGAFWGTVVVSETEEQQCQLSEPSHDIPLLSTEPKVSFRGSYSCAWTVLLMRVALNLFL